MPTFRIPIFQDVSPVYTFEVFEPTHQQNDDAAETSNFAVATFLNQCYQTIEDILYLYSNN
jgi:hypothetical protein